MINFNKIPIKDESKFSAAYLKINYMLERLQNEVEFITYI